MLDDDDDDDDDEEQNPQQLLAGQQNQPTSHLLDLLTLLLAKWIMLSSVARNGATFTKSSSCSSLSKTMMEGTKHLVCQKVEEN